MSRWLSSTAKIRHTWAISEDQCLPRTPKYSDIHSRRDGRRCMANLTWCCVIELSSKTCCNSCSQTSGCLTRFVHLMCCNPKPLTIPPPNKTKFIFWDLILAHGFCIATAYTNPRQAKPPPHQSPLQTHPKSLSFPIELCWSKIAKPKSQKARANKSLIFQS